MDGKELLDLYPEEYLEGAEEERLEKLADCADKVEFKQTLQELARKTYPIWIYALPRTGSSWLTKYFFGELYQPAYNEPWDFLQSSSDPEWTEEKINCGTGREKPRPEITRQLELYEPPEDRLTLAVHKRFVYKDLCDFDVVPGLKSIFPRSRFVWLTRDGRDQVDSFYNPDTDHWPQTKFEFLGEEKEERFVGAVRRFVNFTQTQLEILRENKNRVARIKYEAFTDDFQGSARKILKFAGIPFTDKQLKEQEEKFDARHGMWEEWDLWQRQIFFDSGAEELNRVIDYGNEEPAATNVWERPLPEPESA